MPTGWPKHSHAGLSIYCCLPDLIIRDLYDRGRLLSELGLKTVNHSKHTFPEEREVEVWILPPAGVKNLLSPKINISALKVMVRLALVEGFGGIFSLLMLSLELTGKAGHFDL